MVFTTSALSECTLRANPNLLNSLARQPHRPGRLTTGLVDFHRPARACSVTAGSLGCDASNTCLDRGYRSSRRKRWKGQQ